jgi:hypothetical protein
MPALRARVPHICLTPEAVSLQPGMRPGNSNLVGFAQRQYRRNNRSSLGDSITWRDLSPLPWRTTITIRFESMSSSSSCNTSSRRKPLP